MWDNIRRPNLQIIGIEEGEESQVYGLDQIFNKIIEENFPKLRKKYTHTDTKSTENTK